MEQNNIYIQLEELLHITENYEEASRAINVAQKAVSRAVAYTPSRLKTFDETYKEKFILSIAGEEPKPAAVWNPLNHTKKRKESALKVAQIYAGKKEFAETQYYEKHKEKRSTFEQDDAADKESKIIGAEAALAAAQKEFEDVESTWKMDTFLSEHLRKSLTIRKLMEYFKDGRTSTLKEAVNLFYDDERKDEEARLAAEHRKKIEEMIAELSTSTQYAVEKAEEASCDAAEALRRAQSAMERADEAYDRAEEAANRSLDSGY